MKRIVIQAALLAALATGVASAQQILINAAGATFPYPMYSKWFDEYHKKFPNLAFNYQSIGSGGGIKQVTEGTVDFGASDGPMTDQQIKEFRDKHGFGILHFPTVMGADVPVYNVSGVSTDAQFHGRSSGRDLPRQDHQMERSGAGESQSRRQAAGRRHRGGPSLRWQRHHLYLDRLSVESQPGMENQSRPRNLR